MIQIIPSFLITRALPPPPPPPTIPQRAGRSHEEFARNLQKTFMRGETLFRVFLQIINTRVQTLKRKPSESLEGNRGFPENTILIT